MSQIDEMLMAAAEGDTVAETVTEPHIVIGSDRRITVPEQLKRIAVQYDHNVETVTFDCLKYWDGRDISGMDLYINYRLPDGTLGGYMVEKDSIRTDADDSSVFHFDWTIRKEVTQIKGGLVFLVCAKKGTTTTDAESGEEVFVEETHWNSELCNSLFVSEGLETEATVAEEYPDLIQQLLAHVGEFEKNASDTIAAAESAAAKAAQSETNAKEYETSAKTAAATMTETAKAVARHDSEIAVERARIDEITAGAIAADAAVNTYEFSGSTHPNGGSLTVTGRIIVNGTVALLQLNTFSFDCTDTETYPASTGGERLDLGELPDYVVPAGGRDLFFRVATNLDEEGTNYGDAGLTIRATDHHLHAWYEDYAPDESGWMVCVDNATTAPMYWSYPVANPELAIPELTDIRVGANGETYSTAGTAVREQFKAVDEEIDILRTDVSNAFKGTARGEVIRVDDVCPVEHKIQAKVKGKNLYFNNATKTTTIDGTLVCTTTVGASAFTLNGTSTTETSVQVSRDIPLKAGTYTVSIYGTNIIDTNNDRLYLANVTGGVITNYIRSGESQTFTIDKDVIVLAQLVFGRETAYNNATCYIQIEEGTTATEYEPYINPLNVTLTVRGADESDPGHTYTPTADGTVLGVKSVAPTMTLFTDTPGAVIDIEYSRDVNKLPIAKTYRHDIVISGDATLDVISNTTLTFVGRIYISIENTNSGMYQYYLEFDEYDYPLYPIKSDDLTFLPRGTMKASGYVAENEEEYYNDSKAYIVNSIRWDGSKLNVNVMDPVDGVWDKTIVIYPDMIDSITDTVTPIGGIIPDGDGRQY